MTNILNKRLKYFQKIKEQNKSIFIKTKERTITNKMLRDMIGFTKRRINDKTMLTQVYL